jgi:hypothetical protein
MKASNSLNIRPISEAPRVKGTRILAYVLAAESPDGWMEMYWSGRQYGWQSVIEHPYSNACLTPRYFMDVPKLPKEQA